MRNTKISRNLSSIIIILICILLISGFFYNVKYIKLLEGNGFVGSGRDIINIYDNNRDIDIVLRSIKNGNRADLNLVDFAKVDYFLEITYLFNTHQGYYLILDRKGKAALFIKANDLNTGFEVQKDEYDHLMDIIQ